MDLAGADLVGAGEFVQETLFKRPGRGLPRHILGGSVDELVGTREVLVLVAGTIIKFVINLLICFKLTFRTSSVTLNFLGRGAPVTLEFW